jgi:putative transposase
VQKHRKLQPRLGTRKLMVLLWHFINEHKIKMGRDALFDLLREHHLLIRKRKTTVQTTFSKHWYQKYPNLVKQYEPFAANLLWVSDITYICLEDGFAYLSLITDAYSRKIVGFYLAKTLETIGCIHALQMALDGCSDGSSLIHHSDRGIQYCSGAYVDLLKEHRIKISMTANADPLENAIAERVNGILKDELLKQKYSDFKTARCDVAKAIVIYNTLRPHSSCNMLTPQMAHLHTDELKKHWKNYYRKKEVIMAAT